MVKIKKERSVHLMVTVDARRQQCPIPVIWAKEAIEKLTGSGVVMVFVDNEIAVQNLTKLAQQKKYKMRSEKLGENEFRAIFTIGDGDVAAAAEAAAEKTVCYPDGIKENALVVITSDMMGDGDESLGKTLLKGFIFALSKTEILPKRIVFYNRGAFVTIEGSESIDDLKSLEAQGVEIVTCGTCLNHYGITDKLAVGSVTNMYVIVESMTQAVKIIKP